MAAGKVSVPRRGDLSHASRKPSGHCGAYSYGDFGSGVKNRSDLEIGVGFRAEKTVVFDNDTQVRRKEAIEMDDGILLPSQKKRKFSPVEQVRCSSLLKVNLDDDDDEPGQLDEEDFTHVPNISMSRWAYDDDDNAADAADVVVEHSSEILGRVVRSSPESGVTQKDSSDVSGSRSNESIEDDFSESDLENEDRMELDSMDSDDCVVSKSAVVSDDGAEAETSGKGSRDMLQSCRSVFKYKKLGKISEGSYGIVYKAMDDESREIVALKKMKMGNEREGFPVFYLREINTLMSMNHPSIVNVREVVVDDSNDGFDNIYMVMDYVEHDLKAVMQARKQPFRHSEVKCLMLQLLEGVKYLHDNWVLHRDLKTSNLLLNSNGELKICDFGMSRQYGSPLKPYTALVVTLWYRAPELLLGAKEYSTAVDMWSVGCIMAELLANKPLFDGKTEFEQLDKIFRTLGTPNENIWPGFSQLPGIKVNFVNQPYNQLPKKFPRTSFTGSPVLSDLGLDLLSRLLTYDPEKRITAEEALNHPWFQ